MKKVEKHEICPNCGPWKEDDARMWKMQCQIGDAAFQHLFCISKGKPLPDWVNERLPNMYGLLEENKELRKEISDLKEQIFQLR